jgi:hypothetical protein
MGNENSRMSAFWQILNLIGTLALLASIAYSWPRVAHGPGQRQEFSASPATADVRTPEEIARAAESARATADAWRKARQMFGEAPDSHGASADRVQRP